MADIGGSGPLIGRRGLPLEAGFLRRSPRLGRIRGVLPPDRWNPTGPAPTNCEVNHLPTRIPRGPRSGGGLLVSLLILVVLVAAGAFVVVGAKNGAVEKQETVAQKWADVETTLQRRFDLIPNLVETVKGAANFEQETLTAVTEARASVGQAKLELGQDALADPEALQKYMAAQQTLGGALSRLMVVAERYPELKATQNFADLQHQLEGTENRIAVARQDYNAAVKDFNTFVRKIPNKWFLSEEEFPPKPLFEAAPAALGEAPKVDFGG
ncbi:MAG: LemA family protein [Planctomycetota bacterium]|nr:MAG: LemA family protein [Planctomycetota bacterium]